MKTHPTLNRLFAALIPALFLTLPAPSLSAQSVLVMLGTTTNTIVSLNLLTCEQTPVAPGLSMQINDFWMMPDGTIYVTSFSSNAPYNGQMYRYDPATGTTTLLLDSPAGGGGALYGLSDSTLLWQQFNSFYIYNINQNTLTLLGTQSGFNVFSEIFEYNGGLYINSTNGIFYQIILSPTFSLQAVSLFPVPSKPLEGVCNKLFGPILGNEAFGELDVSTGTYNALCYNDFVDNGFFSWAPDPQNASGPLCDCSTESGTFAIPPYLLSSCSLDPIPIPHNGDENLDGDDRLVFVLFTYDYTVYPDVKYNIIHTYTSPVANFIPSELQTGTYYYMMAVAANMLADTVDLDDPCADFSQDILTLIWAESPTVTFSGNTAICGGGCQTITATFTGNAPFTLTYKVTAGGNTQTFTQTFNDTTGTFQVCPPAGYSGPLLVAATNLIDQNCTCGN
jgi:hypothetical protein